ncbi:hypothetical protein [Desulfosporosinus sp. BG]|uniref:hypothetical protein n=1 Tax=Desulfosporosinus sp. BG TaxID=1633135 RepID=UPI000839F821|nr:hypothetical protein [Desulfosporosinus sp. BG]ODA41242.1 hypothetical protein DSBG_2013 [Desulfosporosinus sp. BG]
MLMASLSKRIEYGGLRFNETTAHKFNILAGIIPPEGYTDEVTVTPKARQMTQRQQRATFSSDAYNEKTTEQRAALAIAYDNSKLLAAARIESRQNAQSFAMGKSLSYEAAYKFASTQ